MKEEGLYLWEEPFSQTEAMEKADDISAEVDDSKEFYGVLDLSLTLGKTCLQNCPGFWQGWWVWQWLVDGNGFGKAKL